MQQGDSDCALFAIATATSLCHGESPNSIRWDQKLMWAHLSKSFELGKMMPFLGWELRSIEIGSEEIVKELKVMCTAHAGSNKTNSVYKH